MKEQRESTIASTESESVMLKTIYMTKDISMVQLPMQRFKLPTDTVSEYMKVDESPRQKKYKIPKSVQRNSS